MFENMFKFEKTSAAYNSKKSVISVIEETHDNFIAEFQKIEAQYNNLMSNLNRLKKPSSKEVSDSVAGEQLFENQLKLLEQSAEELRMQIQNLDESVRKYFFYIFFI